MRLKLAVWSTYVLSLTLLAPLASAATLNDTGQVACFDDSASAGTVASGTPRPEPTGFEWQDCVYGASAADAVGKQLKLGGSSVPGRDYSKIANNGSVLANSASRGTGATDWGCTRDNITGLVWELRPSDGSLRDASHRFSWSDHTNTDGDTCNGLAANCDTDTYVASVNMAGVCGANDWRLPTPVELMSLVALQDASSNLIDGTWIPDQDDAQASTGFWTNQVARNSLIYPRDPDTPGPPPVEGAPNAGWLVAFDLGYAVDGALTSAKHVRLVRGGETPPVTRFTVSDAAVAGEFTTTDALTGLEWKTCLQGFSGSDCLTGSEDLLDWSAALQAAANESFAGKSDWRLPNIVELDSIRDFNASDFDTGNSSTIDPNAFPNSNIGFATYWSSTTDPGFAVSGFGYRYQSTLTNQSSVKSSTLLVRLVRGGNGLAGALADGDFTPDAFTLNDVSTPTSSLAVSNTITVAGLSGPTNIKVTGASESAYQVNGGAFTDQLGTVNNGDQVTVRHRAAATASTTATTTLNIGGTTEDFVTTTTAPTQVSNVLVSLSSSQANATGVTVDISFTLTTPLAVGDQIFVTLPGFSSPAAPSALFTQGAGTATVAAASFAANQLTVTTSTAVIPAGAVTLRATGFTNPAAGTIPKAQLTVWTTKDTAPVASAADLVIASPLTFTTQPAVLSRTATSITAVFRLSGLNDNVRITALTAGSPAPTVAEVIANSNANKRGTPDAKIAATGADQTLSVTGLTANTSYDIYAAIEYSGVLSTKLATATLGTAVTAVTISAETLAAASATNVLVTFQATTALAAGDTITTMLTGYTFAAGPVTVIPGVNFVGNVTGASAGGSPGIVVVTFAPGASVAAGTQATFAIRATNPAAGTLAKAGLTVATSKDTVPVASSADIVITPAPGPAAKLAFIQPPSGGGAGSPFTTQPQVAIQDATGITVTNTPLNITLSKQSGTGTFSCSASSVATVNGVATFSGCQVDVPTTNLVLTASAMGLPSVSSPAITATAPPLQLSVDPQDPGLVVNEDAWPSGASLPQEVSGRAGGAPNFIVHASTSLASLTLVNTSDSSIIGPDDVRAVATSSPTEWVVFYRTRPDTNGTVTMNLFGISDAGSTDNIDVTVSVRPMNDPPSASFLNGSTHFVLQTLDPFTVPGFITGTSVGPADEVLAAQTVSSMEFISDDRIPLLISTLPCASQLPSLNSAGDLSLTPSLVFGGPGSLGGTICSYQLRVTDDGGNPSPSSFYRVSFSMPEPNFFMDLSFSVSVSTLTKCSACKATAPLLGFELSNRGSLFVSGARLQMSVPRGITSPTWTCSSPSGGCVPASGTGAVDTLVDVDIGESASIVYSGDYDGSPFQTIRYTLTPPADLPADALIISAPVNVELNPTLSSSGVFYGSLEGGE